ncbi:uncharacterized protein CcaverHIS019_0312370 [Cutaneotrichosporon cavernicola]|uniref:Uncharacterized protein n=1 Tax=Cutaneotrichosporon cavernicola TaxID=279322 RepID=A0AA48L397_9TREE|nr:uncharacterized protein CcaverHIS019_0312370 [Cutaneotrichosporon cavernicola]BEI91167.1 hypothetical protein CcaverHIS019_0312370 [Cutaneotrichosporon cavernicola]
MPSEGSADSDCCSAMQADLRPPEAPPSLSSIPVTPATSVSFGPDDFVLAFERQSLGNTPSDSDESTESTPTSSPEGTIERPKRRVCVELELGSNRRSLSAFIGRPYV